MKNHAKMTALITIAFLSFMGTATGKDDNIKLKVMHPPFHLKPNAQTLSPTGLTPQQVRHAYGFDQILNQGAGEIIAIIDAYDDPNIEKDLAVFNNTFGLPACTTSNGCFTKVYASNVRPRTSADWSIEIALDVEWAHAIAPKAKILLVEANSNYFTDLMKAVNVALNRGAHIVSMSWGGSEFSTEKNYDTSFNKSNVIFTASSGDAGTGTLFPSTSPFVLAVGGTTIKIDSLGNYLQEIAWSGSGGGQSLYQPQPAYQLTYQIPIYQPVPSGNPLPRGVPDIAYHADPNNGFSVYSSVKYGGRTGWFVIGGTSAGAPQWASFLVIVNSARKSLNKSPLNNVHQLLYTDGKIYTNYTMDFYDILNGNNGNCGLLCTTTVGYDNVTGLGSMQAYHLYNILINSP